MEQSKQRHFAKYLKAYATLFSLQLRFHLLIGRHFLRNVYSLKSFRWLNSGDNTKDKMDAGVLSQCFAAFGISNETNTSVPKSPSREVMMKQASKKNGKSGLSGISENDVNDIESARGDFKSFQHLFFIEWRHRICNYLGAHLAQEFPWYAAWYFIEAKSCGLRQCVRLRERDAEDMRFTNISSFKSAIRSLPSDFTIIQLLLDCNNILWLIRCHCEFEPIIFPLTKIDIGRDEIARQMFDILVDNDETVKPGFPRTMFWKKRYEIDRTLEKLTQSIENIWLSNFKALLIPFGKPSNEIKKRVDRMSTILTNHGFSKDRSPFLARLFLHASKDDYEFLLSIFERHLFAEDYDKEDLYNELLSNSGMSTSAVKKYLEQERYTVLIVATELSSYPWEVLPTFLKNPLVLRTQSLHFFSRLLKKASSSLPMTTCSKKSFYLLNPGGDLKKTEERFEEKIDLEKLQGIKGQPPERSIFNEIWEKNDYYFYIGHGSGSRYTHSTSIRRALCNAVTVLMGCSSVRIEDEARGFDGKSAANDYAVAGSPCIVGCLWMVTDGEIDKFFIAFLESCFIEWSKSKESILKANQKNGSYPYRLLIKALVRAREACKLKFLTSGSVVVYGIPVFNDYADSKSDENEPDVIVID